MPDDFFGFNHIFIWVIISKIVFQTFVLILNNVLINTIAVCKLGLRFRIIWTLMFWRARWILIACRCFYNLWLKAFFLNIFVLIYQVIKHCSNAVVINIYRLVLDYKGILLFLKDIIWITVVRKALLFRLILVHKGNLSFRRCDLFVKAEQNWRLLGFVHLDNVCRTGIHLL